jgi:hypothetical protein
MTIALLVELLRDDGPRLSTGVFEGTTAGDLRPNAREDGLSRS